MKKQYKPKGSVAKWAKVLQLESKDQLFIRK